MDLDVKLGRRVGFICCIVATAYLAAAAHDLGTAITWNREISRIIYAQCASCHRPGGSSFSLLTYQDVQPRAVAIRDSVQTRRMPPWGAVNGFGDFRNDQALTQEQIELIADWVEQGMVKGNNPNALPQLPKFPKSSEPKVPKDAIRVSGDLTLQREFTLDGLVPDNVPDGSAVQVVATLPDGRMEPLLWLYEYKNAYRHPFLLRTPLALPAGSVIRGVPKESAIFLLPAKGAPKSR